MKKYKSYENLPSANQKILNLINEKCNGNINKFANELGIERSQKINRLFKLDNRNNSYPSPSSEILKLINMRYGVSSDFILNDNLNHVNNITISSNKINGDKNIVGNNNDISDENNNYIEIIKKQQEQIDKLITLLSSK